MCVCVLCGRSAEQCVLLDAGGRVVLYDAHTHNMTLNQRGNAITSQRLETRVRLDDARVLEIDFAPALSGSASGSATC